jgi:hypothetical protein
MTAAERQRSYRQRKRDGRAVLRVSVQLERLAMALSEDAFLKQWDEDNPAAIAKAIEVMLETYTTSIIGGVTDNSDWA